MINHSLGSIYIDLQGIVRMTFEKDSELSIDNVGEYSQLWEKVCAGEKRVFLIDLRDSFISIPLDFLKEISSDSNAVKWKKAEAILIDSLPQRMMVNFYKKMETIKFPVKIFIEENEAINWLTQC